VVILPSTFLKILRQCKILVAFRVVLRTFFDSDQADAGTGSIVVPTLQSTDIELDSTVMEAFFAPLPLPSLGVVEMRSRIGKLWSQPLLDLENRSGCRVEVFISDKIPLELLEATMKALPDVIDFRVETRELIPDSIVETIISDKLLLCLESMSVWMASSRVTLDLLESRWLEGVSKGISRGTIMINEDERSAHRDDFSRLERAIAERGAEVDIEIL
jgi:hypothetical protein